MGRIAPPCWKLTYGIAVVASIRFYHQWGTAMSNRLNHLIIVLVVLLAVLSVGPGQAIAQENTLAKPVVNIQVDGTSIELSWESVEGADRYVVWQWDQVNEWTRLDDDNLTDTTFTKSDLAVGVKYFYAVRAVAEGKTSEYSEYVSATIESGASPAPTSTPTPTQAAGSVSTPSPTVTPTATSVVTAEPTVEPTVTPLPVEGDDNCAVIQHLDSFTMKLQPRTLTAFVGGFGEAPVARKVHTAWFVPTTGMFEIGYLVITSDDQYAMIWEFWKGCQYNGGIMYRSDYKGNRLDE